MTDFGFTCKETAGKAPSNQAPESYKSGYYGTPSYTAPELLGVVNFSGHHSKTDVFALGMSLGEFFGMGDMSWINKIKELNKAVKENPDLLDQGRKEIQQLLQENVEDKVTALSSKPNKGTKAIIKLPRRQI